MTRVSVIQNTEGWNFITSAFDGNGSYDIYTKGGEVGKFYTSAINHRGTMTDDILELEKDFILEEPKYPTVLGFMAVKITQAIASLDRGAVDEATLLLYEAQKSYFRYVNAPKKVVKNWA